MATARSPPFTSELCSWQLMYLLLVQVAKPTATAAALRVATLGGKGKGTSPSPARAGSLPGLGAPELG